MRISELQLESNSQHRGLDTAATVTGQVPFYLLRHSLILIPTLRKKVLLETFYPKALEDGSTIRNDFTVSSLNKLTKVTECQLDLDLSVPTSL